MSKQAIILAGGKGTRLAERLNGRPKPLIEIAGVPLLQRQLLSLKQAGFCSILILVNHAADQIIDFCLKNNSFGMDIVCIDDGQPLGTAGATLSVYEQLHDEFLVVYGDTLFEIDLDRFEKYHHSFPAAAATLFVHPNDHPADSDLVEVDDGCKVLAFHGYPHLNNRYYPNLVNAALYLIRKESLVPWLDVKKALDFGKDLFPMMIMHGYDLRAYNSPEYIKDCGTPKRVDRVTADIISGKVKRACLSHPQRAVFLDRDGTLNPDVGHLHSVDQFELYPGVSEAIKKLNNYEFRSCLITNQPVIARGDCSLADLYEIHNKMESLIAVDGAYLDRIYFCPHHPDSGFSGERVEYKLKCHCRKPHTGMVEAAVKDLNIDLQQSWFIGDRTTDLLTAENAGIKSILVETGAAGLDQMFPVLPNFVKPDLQSAVDFITEEYPRLIARFEQELNVSSSARFLFIGGLSRSGKSTLASVFADVIRKQGRNVKVISIDRWLRSEKEREPSVLGRYDILSLSHLIQEIALNKKTISISMPFYHRLKRVSQPDASLLNIDQDDLVIIEGTIALALNHFEAADSYHVMLDEEVRRQRVIDEYLLRGESLESAVKIYEKREIDESPVIADLKHEKCKITIL